MDKILELLIEYFRIEIEEIKKNNETENKIFWPFYILRIYKNIYIPLFLIFILWLFNTSNDIFKEMAIFSFYAIIVISLLFYISYVWYKKEEEENSNAKEKMKSLIDDLIENNKQKIILKDIQDKFEKDFEDYTNPRKRIRITLQKLAKEWFLEREKNWVYIIKR